MATIAAPTIATVLSPALAKLQRLGALNRHQSGSDPMGEPSESTTKTALLAQGGAKSGAPALEPDLAAIVAAWSHLPEPIKAAIRALIASASSPEPR